MLIGKFICVCELIKFILTFKIKTASNVYTCYILNKLQNFRNKRIKIKYK